MRKFLLSILFFVFACANAWGATSYTLTGTASNKTLTITGSGAMSNYASTKAPWYNDRTDIKYVVIQSGVTSIGEYAFQNCTTLVSVTIPTSCTSFGNNAFNNCTSVENIYYAGTPNQWAQVTFSAASSHPFNRMGTSNSCKYFFNGDKTTHTTKLVFTPGLTEIKAYTFCNAGTLTTAYIPGSVTYIRQFGLRSAFSEVYINKSTRPGRDDSNTNFIGFKSTGILYVPLGATSSYSTNSYGWKKHASYNTVGYNSISEFSVSGTVDGVAWTLNSNGVFTLTGPGELTTSFQKASGASQYPYYNCRYLVDKFVVTGGVTALSNIIQRMEALRTLEFQQNNIPTKTATIPTDYIYADGTLKMLFPYTAVENVDPESWSSYKRQLSNTAILGDSEDQTSIIEALHDNLTEPFTLQLNRTLIVDGDQYNTFCSPIDLTKAQLNDADIRALTGTSLNGDELTLTFSEDPLEGIEAGKPYLVKPSSPLANPTFEDIDPSDLVSATENTETDLVDFIGVLAPTGLTGGDHNTLFLGADNELLWPEADGNIGGMRAYFSVKEAAQKNGIKARIVMNKEVATDIESISDEGLPVTGKKILRNGQLFIIRDNKTYNAQGQLVK